VFLRDHDERTSADDVATTDLDFVADDLDFAGNDHGSDDHDAGHCGQVPANDACRSADDGPAGSPGRKPDSSDDDAVVDGGATASAHGNGNLGAGRVCDFLPDGWDAVRVERSSSLDGRLAMNVTSRRAGARRRFLPGGRRVAAAVVAVMAAIALSSAGSTAPSGAATPGRFPSARWAKGLGPVHLSSPVVADVNGDGHLDVVTADLSGELHVLDGRTGRDLRGWPQPVQVVPGQTVAVESSPTVADLDHNGKQEIIVGAGSVDYSGQQGGVVAFNANGSVRWRFKTMTVNGLNAVVGTPAVGDVDGDGFPDVVFGSFDQRIYALNRFGQALVGFPFFAKDTVWDSAALADVGHTGRMDIFIGSDSSPNAACPQNWSWAGIFRAIRETPAGPVVRWSFCQHQIFQSSPAIGDLDGSGRLAAVIGAGVAIQPGQGDPTAARTLQAVYLDNGQPVPGWPVRVSGAIFGSPVIGDLTGDHRNSVVVGTFDQQVWAIGGHGKVMWHKPGGYLGTPILVDLDGDGANDVAIGSPYSFDFLRGRDGAALYGSLATGIVDNSAAVANFGGRYGWQLVIASGSGPTGKGAGMVQAYPLPQAPHVAPAWPQWRYGARHTGAAPGAPPPPAHGGYWIATSSGGIFAYGNAKYYGSTGGAHLNRPIVGMARTPSGHGYWLVASDGGMFAFGDAKFHGSTGAMHLNRPIVGMASTPSGHGYWLVASDGGMFAFGDAKFYGSTGAMHLNRPIVGMVSTSNGHGYWLVASDGGMFSFGNAKFHGSTGGIHLVQPIVGMASTPNGRGYWLVASDGGIFAFGNAKFCGSTGGRPLGAPISTIAPTATGNGYWLVGQNGDVFNFGDANYVGAPSGQTNQPIVSAAASRRS
jgi:ribosomal protein L24E